MYKDSEILKFKISTLFMERGKAKMYNSKTQLVTVKEKAQTLLMEGILNLEQFMMQAEVHTTMLTQIKAKEVRVHPYQYENTKDRKFSDTIIQCHILYKFLFDHLYEASLLV